MYKKCILWARVSTNAQETDTQIEALKKMCYQDGYINDNQIITICEKGASAIMVNKKGNKYLEMIRELEDHIKKDETIKAVYAFEISRIGRKESYIHRVKDFLTDRKIQLKIHTPQLVLFNEDKDGNITDVNQNSTLLFSIIASIAQTEMVIKKDRLKRGQQRNFAEGKKGCGKLHFGYTTDENKNIIIDEKEAEVVRRAFQVFNTQHISTVSLYDEFYKNGLFTKKYKRTASKQSFVSRLLRNYNYAGVEIDKDNQFFTYHKYPKIVDKEQIDLAYKRLADNTKKPKTKTDFIYYGKSILRCGICGKVLHVEKNNVVYRCSGDEIHPKNDFISVNLNVLDSILWHEAKAFKIKMSIQQTQTDRQQIKKTISEKEKAVTVQQKELSTYQTKDDKIVKLYLDGIFSEEILIKNKKEIDDERQKTIDIITQLKNEISNLQNLLKIRQQNKPYKTFEELDKLTDKEKKSIIDETIDSVLVYNLGDKNKKIVVNDKLGINKENGTYFVVEYVATNRKRTDKKHRVTYCHDGKELIEFEDIIYRLERKNYRKKKGIKKQS